MINYYDVPAGIQFVSLVNTFLKRIRRKIFSIKKEEFDWSTLQLKESTVFTKTTLIFKDDNQ